MLFIGFKRPQRLEAYGANRAERRLSYAIKGFPGKMPERLTRINQIRFLKVKSLFEKDETGAKLIGENDAATDRMTAICGKAGTTDELELGKKLNRKQKREFVDCVKTQLRYKNGFLGFLKKNGAFDATIRVTTGEIKKTENLIKGLKKAWKI